MPWYLYLALRQLFPTGRRFPFFTLISILGVALGVAILLIVTSVMGGFGYNIRELTVNTQGDVQVRAAGIDDPAAVQAVLAKTPGVVASTPFAEGLALMLYERRPQTPVLQGIDLEQVRKVI